ncbi:MAG TPA: type II secretion system inner membrane protein GspF [Gammaproteobacteria bacterium]|jgi:general secretion pathway protein F|nr:type II secretion system inner membrane protein GspF [Gammaproteobacteria bacterium]
MPAYHYIALPTQGKEQKGVIEAENERHARQLLRESALFPLKVHLVKEGHHKKNDFSRWLSLSAFSFFNHQLLSMILRQLATLLSAGLPVETALLAIAEQTERAKEKGIVFAMRSKVVEGYALSEALLDHPHLFPPLLHATVAAGEKTGRLDSVLLRLADYTEQQWHMRKRLVSALIYPAMVLCSAFFIVGFLLAYIVPKMVSVYTNLHQDLPFLTKMLIALSGFAQATGIYFLLFFVLSVVACRRAISRVPALKLRVHRWLLKLPLLGKLLRATDTARFSRTLSILSVSGVPVVEAMQVATALITMVPIRLAVQEAVSQVQGGVSISRALKQTGYFSPMSVHMMSSGEASGQLESMLDRVAQNQETDVAQFIDISLRLFEPMMIILMGGMVLFIVLAVLLPIFQWNQFVM